MTPTTRRMLLGAFVCAAAFGALIVIAYTWPEARMADAAGRRGFNTLGSSVPVWCAGFVVFGSPPGVGFLAALLILLALGLGRPREAVFVFVLLGITSVTGQVLKQVLAFHRPDLITGETLVQADSFPSGHGTASMSLAVALVVIVPPRLKVPAAALGAILALAVSFSMLLLGGHFPSDIPGGFLLAMGTGFVLLAVLNEYSRRRPESQRASSIRKGRVGRASEAFIRNGLAILLALTAFVVAAGLIALVALGWDFLLNNARANTKFFGSSAIIAAIGVLMMAGFAWTLRRYPPDAPRAVSEPGGADVSWPGP